uniref:EGF-like domain-containing protein n=1 Tax=Myripristis murdjan TaxID=586833 RepID=A0A667WWC6_9TELE
MGFCRFVCVFVLATVRASTGQVLECHPGEWLCGDGNCIPDIWRCDGDGDCLDGTDEMDCPPRHLSLDCPAGQFSCVDSVSCVNESALCDGQHQCPTGSDEENCTTSDSCLDSDWTCLNHICIPKELRCDGRNDCLDNSDEQDCGRCEDGVRCPEGLCLSAEDRCDGKVHCSDGSDEPATCGRRCSEANGGCSHVCTDEPWGARCSCPAGYKLSANGVVCEDVDECTQPFASCLQHCTNTVGSYYCHCREGFTLNGTSMCVATGNATRLLTLRKGSIGLLNVETRQFEVIHTPNSNPVALTFDLIRGLYYWADRRGNIFKTDGRDSETVYAGEPGIKGLACDWLNGHLYWTNQNTEAIYMGASDGKGFTTLLSKNIQPAELVLLPVESLMFWINGGPGDRMTLEKSWMDGSEKSSLVVLTAQSPYGLTMDVAARRLYWISDFKKSIETVKVDGSGRYSFMGLFSSSPALGLVVFESWFYWVDDKGLWQAPQHQPSHRNLLQRATLPLLLVYHELQQPRGSYACVKTPCHLCLLTKGNPLGFSCACPNSKVLLPDGACEYPRFVYSTTSEITMLEFKGKETRKTLLFTTDAGILSFDLDWYRDWLYWVNQIGQVQRISLTNGKMEMVATLLPVCLVKVDQRTGSLYWMSCDQACIGVTAADRGFPRSLYRTKKDIHDMYLDWLRGGLLWLEGDLIFSMSLSGGEPREMLNTGGGIKGSVVLDLRASSLLWNSERTGLTTMSLLQDKRRSAGKRWTISGSIVAAFEPFP